MKIQLVALFCIAILTSCQRMERLKGSSHGNTSALVVPIGFKWENSRIINVQVSIKDARFGTAKNRILIYDKDPAVGGKLIMNGFATTKAAYIGKIYLPNKISSFYIIKTAVNHSSVASIVDVRASDIILSM